jgi:hypothetical protein
MKTMRVMTMETMTPRKRRTKMSLRSRRRMELTMLRSSSVMKRLKMMVTSLDKISRMIVRRRKGKLILQVRKQTRRRNLREKRVKQMLKM